MSPRNPLQVWRERSIDQRLAAHITQVERYLDRPDVAGSDDAPVLFFNASTRIHRLSLNAAYSLLASWGLRARQVPVRYLVCAHGMEQCILGARPDRMSVAPPCRACIRLSKSIFPPDLTLLMERDAVLAGRIEAELSGMSVQELAGWTWEGIPLGQLVLPGLRWVLRQLNLPDDKPTRTLYSRFLGSSVSLAGAFSRTLTSIRPRAVVVFNGIFYPEALLRYQAISEGFPVISHEVGLQPFSAFFSHQEATFREIDIQGETGLGLAESQRLDHYLDKRTKGEFTMAGIRFWETIEDIPPSVKAKATGFEAMVSIFTNVVFDTSQVHANTIFTDMFAWLDHLKQVIEHHPELLFILRAHPDEIRPGKASEESVSQWVAESSIDQLANTIFIPPEERINSYRLIEESKLVLVYNSSIGLEASILGKPVLSAGRSRYTQADTVLFPPDRQTYASTLERMLAEAQPVQTAQFRDKARVFLYHELFRASLDLSNFLQADPTLAGMVVFKNFDLAELQQSASLRIISRGILDGAPFLLDS